MGNTTVTFRFPRRTIGPMSTTDLPAPETLDGSPVLISRPLRTRAGEQPGHAVVCDRGVWSSAPFETWLVRSGDGGRSWQVAPGGTWDTLVEAQADLLALVPDTGVSVVRPAAGQRPVGRVRPRGLEGTAGTGPRVDRGLLAGRGRRSARWQPSAA